MNDETTRLSDQQLARIEAMKAVAHYVRDIKFMGGTPADPTDLIRLSEYVLNGVVAAAVVETLQRKVRE